MKALRLAHAFVLKLLDVHNEYFKLGLKDEIPPRLQAFLKIWNRAETKAQ